MSVTKSASSPVKVLSLTIAMLIAVLMVRMGVFSLFWTSPMRSVVPLMLLLVLVWCWGGVAARSRMVPTINVAIIFADHVLMPLSWLVDRVFLWPFVISVWFVPARPWPKPWNVSYSKLLDALTEFFLERYPSASDGRHPYSLSEEEFEAMVRARQATHTMIPFPMHWIGVFIRALPPLTTTVVSIVLIPALRWFVGPMRLHVDEEGDVGVEVMNCRFLREAREKLGKQDGENLCVKQCGIVMEQIWRERAGIETWLDPDLDTGRCRVHAKLRPKCITYLDKNCGTCACSVESLDW